MTTRRPRTEPGRILLLNGVPRSGKSTTAQAFQAQNEFPTVHLGVDLIMAATQPQLLPGIGLRPGGERPDLEPFVRASWRALFDTFAAHATQGIDVVADLGIHGDHAEPADVWAEAVDRLDGLATWVIGIRCPIETILERRAADPDRYQTAVDGQIPAPVARWEAAVHHPGWYDLEVDTSTLTPAACAVAILAWIRDHEPSALERHRRRGLTIRS